MNECDSKYVVGIFVDFRGAFSHVLWDVAMEKLKNEAD